MNIFSYLRIFVVASCSALLTTTAGAELLPRLGQIINIENSALKISFPRIVGADDMFSQPFRLRTAREAGDFVDGFYSGRMFPCGSMFFRCKSDFSAQSQISYTALSTADTASASPEEALRKRVDAIDRKQDEFDQRPLPSGATLLTFGKPAATDRRSLQFLQLESGIWATRRLIYDDGSLAGVHLYTVLSPRRYLRVFLKVLQPDELPREVTVERLVEFAQVVAANTKATLLSGE